MFKALILTCVYRTSNEDIESDSTSWTDSVYYDCNFLEGEGSVEIFPAPIKTMSRMREKVMITHIKNAFLVRSTWLVLTGVEA